MHNVSACILSYDRKDYLCEAIDSILRQTIKPSEILVFDNGSHPSVYTQISSYFGQGVKWIGSDATYSAHWNFWRAIDAANSEYLFVLHDDDRVCEDFIEQQMKILNNYRDVVVITCNGYVIDESGDRTGQLLIQSGPDNTVDFYRSSSAVAICYARDSCLPLSPAVYRTDFIRASAPRNLEYFGKVADAVLFCEIARLATVAYQSLPLYECRQHAQQDSKHFATSELNLLTNYFHNETYGSVNEKKVLEYYLIRQHTSRQLLNIYYSIFPKLQVSLLINEIKGLTHKRFSIFATLTILVKAIQKRITIKINKLYF